MYSLDSLEVKNWHLYKQGSFEFKPGISLIGGDNAVGKSLMFAAIPTMFSLIHDKDEIEKAPKGSSLTLHYHKDEVPIHYNLSSLSSTKYNIGVGNIDMHPHKQKDAKKVLRDNWTIPQALFETTVFLQGKTAHPLSTGTSGTRSNWLQNALDLTAIYDAYKAEIDSKIQELGLKIHKISVLREERDKIAAKIPDSTVGKKQYEKAQKLLRKYNKALSTLPAERQELANVISVIEKILELPELDKSMSYYEDKLDTYRMQRAKLKKAAERLDEIQEDLDHNLKIAKRMRVIWELFEGSVDQPKVKKWKAVEKERKRWETQQEAVVEFSKQKAAYDRQADWRKEVEKLARLMIWGTAPKDMEAAQELHAILGHERSELKKKLERLTNIKGRKDCPTCGNPLTEKHLKAELKTIKSRLAELPEKMKETAKFIRYWDLMKEERVKEPKKPSFSYNDHKELGRLLEAHDDYQEAKKELRPVEDIPSKNIDKDLAELDKKVKRFDRLRNASVNLVALTGMLPEELRSMDRRKLTGWMATAKDRIQTIRSDVAHATQVTDKYQSIVVEFETQAKLVSQHRSTLSRMDAEIAELQKETKDLEAYKALATAFGNSGVRLFQLKESAAVLAQKLTELSALFFDTNYHFEIEVAPHKLNVMVERNGRMGSLKSLSGAETRCWNLLCAMALLRILPSSMRCDTMMLDEIEANMSEKSRNRYVRDVIPELMELVPKIVVITPLVSGELPIKPDYDYRVIKERKNGEYHSRLISV